MMVKSLKEFTADELELLVEGLRLLHMREQSEHGEALDKWFKLNLRNAPQEEQDEAQQRIDEARERLYKTKELNGRIWQALSGKGFIMQATFDEMDKVGG